MAMMTVTNWEDVIDALAERAHRSGEYDHFVKINIVDRDWGGRLQRAGSGKGPAWQAMADAIKGAVDRFGLQRNVTEDEWDDLHALYSAIQGTIEGRGGWVYYSRQKPKRGRQ